MQKAYRVKFTNWEQNPTNEYFFTSETDAQNYAEKYKKYGYKSTVETIYFQEVVDECGCSKRFVCFEHMKVSN